MDNQDIAKDVCKRKIERLRELSQKEMGGQFLHHSTLCDYRVDLSHKYDVLDRLRAIAQEGLVPSTTLNERVGDNSIFDPKGCSVVYTSPDFQPVFEIGGNSKVSFLIDPNAMTKERKEYLKEKAKDFFSGAYAKGYRGGDLCEWFEVGLKEIKPDNILGVLIHDDEINRALLEFQCMTPEGKRKAAEKWPGNYSFINEFEDKPENAFPVFRNGLEDKIIDPEKKIHISGKFINLDSTLQNKIYPVDSNNCEHPFSSFKDYIKTVEAKLNPQEKSKLNPDSLGGYFKEEDERMEKARKKVIEHSKYFGFKTEGDGYPNDELFRNLRNFMYLRYNEYSELSAEDKSRFTTYLLDMQDAHNLADTGKKIHELAQEMDVDNQFKYFKEICTSRDKYRKKNYLNLMKGEMSPEKFENHSYGLKIPEKALAIRDKFMAMRN